jgi:hypothetical protein
MLANSVDTFLKELSEYYGVDFDLRWKSKSFRSIGSKIGIKSTNRIKGWLLNGYIPDQTIQKILRLDIPDDLKVLALRCRRSIIPKFTIRDFLTKTNSK